MAQTDLRARSKRAYELGRLRLGLIAALPVIPMAALSLAANRRAEGALTLIAASTLFALTVAMRARGQVFGRALWPGYLAGAAPFLLPLLLRSSGHCCIGNACWPICMLGCVSGGVVAGVVIGLSAAREGARGAFLLSAALVAGLAGILGCVMAGASGIAGMALAIAATSLPVTAVARARG